MRSRAASSFPLRKREKRQKTPFATFHHFSETLAPTILKRYDRARGGGKCRLRSASYPSQLRTFTGFFIRFRTRSLNCLNALPAPFSSRRAEPCPVSLFISRRTDRRARYACKQRLIDTHTRSMTTSFIRRGESLSDSRF